LIACEEELCHLKENLDGVKKQNIALASSKIIGTDSLRTQADLLRVHTVADDIPDHEYLPNTKSSVIEYSLEDNTAPESEDESRMSRLDDFNVDMERNRRLAMYELDDMKRINRSLREELEEKCDEFNELNDDVDKFAEAFAAQESELEKLQFENKMLKASASKR
jgi:hypothetical protein